MAKSLRAKSQLKAKSVKRKNVFQVDADARANRIADKMKEDLIKQRLEELKRKNASLQNDEDARKALEADNQMDQDQQAKNVSTSGWRDARHHTYKRNKKLSKNRKKGSFTKF
ncbi:LAME_0F02630g1_1 [Lachancea meyersii CBS 8951]|uniref:LAME_0F02630g1_1 n=1 Tax=Lachancea meyersii CBS 8951 TaxID=1266667 RepID=A0A1G4JQK8_9SACH|nr:LAME_0F02630g1_1 [Lachancea meyersii CBS 8951]